MSDTDKITDFILSPRDIPDSALDMAALLLIDTLGVAAGGAALLSGQLARAHAFRFHQAADPAGAATMLFDGRRASIPGAGFALASQIDNLDAHDGYNPTKGHIGCAVVPALCAFAEGHPQLSAREALATMVMAYEVSTCAALTLHATVSDYHTSGAWNGIGVAALGARLRGLTPDQTQQALGIAEYHGPRSQMMREIANPTMLHDGSGMGALTGAMAVLLAETGFTGAPAVTVFAPEAAPYWQELGQVWTIKRNYIKPYPICRWAHGALEALRQLMTAYDLTLEHVAKMEVGTFAESAQLYPGMPDTTSKAQYSLPFALAVLLKHGGIGPEHIEGAGLSDPEIAAFLPKITIREVPRHSSRFPEGRWSDITLTLANGQVLQSGDTNARGGPEAPMDEAEIEAKFHLMSGALAPERAAAIWQMRQNVLDPDLPFRALLNLITPPLEALS